MIWGYHTLFDCKSGDIYKISSEGNISLFVCDLIFEIDMKAYGPLQIAQFAEHDPRVGGFSFCQMIETSNITGHFVDATGDFYVDIFSVRTIRNTSLKVTFHEFVQKVFLVVFKNLKTFRVVFF